MKSERNLPLHLTENTESKCFVFRHQEYKNRKSVVFSYARGKDRVELRNKAIRFTEKMNRKLPNPKPTSVEGRMSSRNTSGEVGVNPAHHTIRKPSGLEYTYFSWRADWVGCPNSGGVAWPCKKHGCSDAYVLAVLTRRMKSTDRLRILEELDNIRGSNHYRSILRQKPDHSGCEG
jgi:hypothetical protein